MLPYFQAVFDQLAVNQSRQLGQSVVLRQPVAVTASGAVIGNTQLVKTAKQVEVDMGDEAVPLAEQDSFKHG